MEKYTEEVRTRALRASVDHVRKLGLDSEAEVRRQLADQLAIHKVVDVSAAGFQYLVDAIFRTPRLAKRRALWDVGKQITALARDLRGSAAPRWHEPPARARAIDLDEYDNVDAVAVELLPSAVQTKERLVHDVPLWDIPQIENEPAHKRRNFEVWLDIDPNEVKVVVRVGNETVGHLGVHDSGKIAEVIRQLKKPVKLTGYLRPTGSIKDDIYVDVPMQAG